MLKKGEASLTDKEVLNLKKDSVDAVLERPYSFKIVDDKTKDVHELKIHPPCVAVALLIAKKLLTIDYKAILNNDKDKYDQLVEYADILIEVVCLFITNKADYDKKLFNLVKNNITLTDVLELLLEGYARFAVRDFQLSIIVCLPMSLFEEREIIALLEKKEKNLKKDLIPGKS